MTRRIAITILLTVWAILCAAGGLAYFVTRTILLDDLDDTLTARALSLPELERPANILHAAPQEPRDRFIILDANGRNIIARPSSTELAPTPDAQLFSGEFVKLDDGSRVRTLKFHAFQRRANPQDPPVPVTVVYSGSADSFDMVLRQLLMALGGVGLAGGAITAAIAMTVARTALSPMIRSADVISAIDEKSLDRRIDITCLPPELLPVGRTLNEMLDRLQTAFTQRRQFLADASHELRTPVAALVTTLEVALRRSRDASEYGRILQSCLTDAHVLKFLVESLLEQVRSERFASDGASEPVNLSYLLGQCATLAETLAAVKGVHIVRKIDPHLVIVSNEPRLRSIIINLLSNAVEYNRPDGSVEIVATALAPENALFLPTATTPAPPNARTANLALAQRVRIEVRDTGVGIAPDDLQRIFEPFYRADKARNHDTSHLGLGLSLVKSHVEALGGVCRVDSKPGIGTTVRLEIPSVVSVAELQNFASVEGA